MKGLHLARGPQKKSSKAKPEANPTLVLPPYPRKQALTDQRELLEQMDLCQRLMANASDSKGRQLKENDIVRSAIWDWYLVLAATLASTTANTRLLADIPAEPNPEKRALAFFPIISTVVNDLDSTPRDNVKRFLMHVAWHEGARLTSRLQIGGPARGFFQFEAYRAKEALKWASSKKLTGTLAKAANRSEDDLNDSTRELPDFDQNDKSCSSFPTSNLVRFLLETNDQFGTYLARIEFTRFSQPIGNTNVDHAEYWYRYWKRTGGDASRLKKIFADEAKEVDGLIVAAIKQFRFRINADDYILARSGGTWLQKRGAKVTNTYFDRGHDATWVFMDDGPKGAIEIRVPVAGGVGEERMYRKGPWKQTYARDMVVEYY